MQLRFLLRAYTVALFIAASMTLVCWQGVLASETAPTNEMSAFSLRGLDGGTIELETLRGKPLSAVIFFATWSPRSHQALVDIGLLREKYAEKGFDVVMVSAEKEEFPANFDDILFDYLAGTNADVPVAMDDGLNTYRAWKVKAIPSTYFLDKDLRQVNFIGSAPSSYKMMVEDIIKEALGLTPKGDEADKGPTRYQAAKPQMLGYGMAHKLAQRGKSKKAKKNIEAIIKADPDFPDAHALLGMILLHGRQKDTEAAKAAFDKAFETDPNLPVTLLGKAHFALEDDDLDAAVALIRDALGKRAWGFTKKPDEARAKALEEKLANVAALAEKPDEAKAVAQELLDGFLVLKKKTKVNRSILGKMNK